MKATNLYIYWDNVLNDLALSGRLRSYIGTVARKYELMIYNTEDADYKARMDSLLTVLQRKFQALTNEEREILEVLIEGIQYDRSSEE